MCECLETSEDALLTGSCVLGAEHERPGGVVDIVVALNA